MIIRHRELITKRPLNNIHEMLLATLTVTLIQTRKHTIQILIQRFHPRKLVFRKHSLRQRLHTLFIENQCAKLTLFCLIPLISGNVLTGIYKYLDKLLLIHRVSYMPTQNTFTGIICNRFHKICNCITHEYPLYLIKHQNVPSSFNQHAIAPSRTLSLSLAKHFFSISFLSLADTQSR